MLKSPVDSDKGLPIGRILAANLLLLLVTTTLVWNSLVPVHAVVPLFPFVLPWDDASPSATDISSWRHKPAGKFGHIRVGADGHLYAGTERMRFFGVNLVLGASFPNKQDAKKIAARMAKFGINIVRFHHMDTLPFPDGIRACSDPSTRSLDPEALDRLDYLIAQLKGNGIYVNLNLLVSRPFNSADGLPKEIDQLEWKKGHVVGFFYEPIMNLETEYARKLLTHRNPYTGMTYVEDPAVAFVEINNEDGLVSAWLSGAVDLLPKVFLNDLQRQWNSWLLKRYGATEGLREVWKEAPLGDEILVNTEFAHGLEKWVLERRAPAEASIAIAEDVPRTMVAQRSVRIVVNKPSSSGWHVQFNQPNINVQATRRYTLAFWAKADKTRTISVCIMQAHSPWKVLGPEIPVGLTTDWQQFRFVGPLDANDDNARVNFGDLALQTGSYWLADVSFRQGGAIGLGENERIEDGSVPVFLRSSYGSRTEKPERDWLRFLIETEDHYWQAMFRYLKDDLKVKASVIGTAVGCSTPDMMAKLDCVDTHEYWQHPTFPGRLWDPNNWFIRNRTMVNETGGTIPSLSLRRVLGKPFTVTEYNHPAPNTYGSEAYVLLAAYGAFQDWDAIYAFCYSDRRDDWDTRCIGEFFNIDQDPTKLVTLIPAVLMFVGNHVKPAQKEIVVAADREREIDLLRHGSAWGLVDAGRLGVPSEAVMVHRVSIATEGRSVPAGALRPEQLTIEGGRFISDTGELIWDLTDRGRGVVTVNTAKTKAVIGYGGNKQFDLGGVVLKPGESMQNGWCTITLTALEGELSSRAIKGPFRLIITATGYSENTNMGWKNKEKSTVGQDWGVAPSLVEGIPARITLPLPSKQTQAWALDELGQRKASIPVEQDSNGNAVIAIGSQWQTLWYEVTNGLALTTTLTTTGSARSSSFTTIYSTSSISKSDLTTATTTVALPRYAHLASSKETRRLRSFSLLK